MFTIFFMLCALFTVAAMTDAMGRGFELRHFQVRFPLLMSVILIAAAFLSYNTVDIGLWRWMAER